MERIPLYLQAALALIASGMLFMLLAPLYAQLLAWRAKSAQGGSSLSEGSSAADSSRARMAACSAVVLAVPLCLWLKLSLALHVLNVLAVGCAMWCGAALIIRCFGQRPRWLGIPAALLSILGWLLLAALLFFDAVTGESSQQSAEMGGGQHCVSAEYGFVASDQGNIIRVYQRYVLIDRKIGQYVESYIYPADPGPMPELQQQCRRALGAQHVAARR